MGRWITIRMEISDLLANYDNTMGYMEMECNLFKFSMRRRMRRLRIIWNKIKPKVRRKDLVPERMLVLCSQICPCLFYFFPFSPEVDLKTLLFLLTL